MCGNCSFDCTCTKHVCMNSMAVFTAHHHVENITTPMAVGVRISIGVVFRLFMQASNQKHSTASFFYSACCLRHHKSISQKKREQNYNNNNNFVIIRFTAVVKNHQISSFAPYLTPAFLSLSLSLSLPRFVFSSYSFFFLVRARTHANKSIIDRENRYENTLSQQKNNNNV